MKTLCVYARVHVSACACMRVRVYARVCVRVYATSVRVCACVYVRVSKMNTNEHTAMGLGFRV